MGHGADSSNYGARTIEIYNNTFVAGWPSDPYNLANGYLGLERGGSYVFYNNTNPQIIGAYSKVDINMTVMNVQRNSGPHPCWGQGTTGGADYPAPRQVGRGWISGLTSTIGSQISCGSSTLNCNATTHVFSGTVDSSGPSGIPSPHTSGAIAARPPAELVIMVGLNVHRRTRPVTTSCLGVITSSAPSPATHRTPILTRSPSAKVLKEILPPRRQTCRLRLSNLLTSCCHMRRIKFARMSFAKSGSPAQRIGWNEDYPVPDPLGTGDLSTLKVTSMRDCT